MERADELACLFSEYRNHENNSTNSIDLIHL